MAIEGTERFGNFHNRVVRQRTNPHKKNSNDDNNKMERE